MSSQLSRRRFLQLGSAAAGTLLVPSSLVGASSAFAAQTAQPKRGGTVTIAAGLLPNYSFIPQKMTTFSVLQQIESMFLRLVYGVTWGPGTAPATSGPLELGVAKTMTEIEKNRVWEFTLRENVFWHDGKPVTADDLIFGIWMSLNRKLPAEVSAPKPNGILGATRLLTEGSDKVEVEGAKKLGDYAVRIELEVPTPGYWQSWYNAFYPMPSHVLGEKPALAFERPFSTMPLGNGAFKPTRYVEDQFLELAANDAFYLGRPYVDKLVFRAYPAGSNWLAIESQELDGLFAGIPDKNYIRYSKLPYVEGVMLQLASPHGFKVNVKRFPDQYVALHKASMYALDVPFLSNTYYGGALNPHNYNFIHSYGLETPPEGYPTYKFNPDAARKLLADAKWDTNRELSWLVWYEPFEYHEAIASMLGDVGIKTKFNRVDVASVTKALYEESDFDFIYTSSYGGSDMRQMWDQFRTGANSKNGGTNNNFYSNPEMDTLWAQALKETTEEGRKTLFNRIALMMAEKPPMATWMSPNVAHVWNRRIQGAYPFAHFLPVRAQLERMWLANA